jgi:hypothetical protein
LRNKYCRSPPRIFFGGSVGSAVAIVAWRLGGWPAVSLWGAAAAIFAIALRLISRL